MSLILGFLAFGLYLFCLVFIAKCALTLGTLVLQVALKCLPIAIGIWIAAMILKGCFST